MRVSLETKNETRQRILQVAQKQFAERGFEATTTRDIARAAGIAVGTLFNYFPTKESIATCLVDAACSRAAEAFVTVSREAARAGAGQQNDPSSGDESLSLEEELFAHVTAVLRKLKPYRKYLPPVLETTLSPAAANPSGERSSVREGHLEIVAQILSRHGLQDVTSSMSLQLYWTLYQGVLNFWAQDRSPRQEDTLALLDQSLAMYVGWVSGQSSSSESDSRDFPPLKKTPRPQTSGNRG